MSDRARGGRDGTSDDNRSIPIPHGLVRHWMGTIFIPGVRTARVVDLMQDYAHCPDLFNFGVDRSKVLSSQPDDYQVQLRIFRKATSSIFYRVKLDDRYIRLDGDRASRSHPLDRDYRN